MTDIVVGDPGRFLVPAHTCTRSWLRRVLLVSALVLGVWLLLVAAEGTARAQGTAKAEEVGPVSLEASAVPTPVADGAGTGPSQVAVPPPVAAPEAVNPPKAAPDAVPPPVAAPEAVAPPKAAPDAAP